MRTGILFSILLFFIILCLYFYYLYENPSVFPLDDAYIHFVYAENLAAGHGLCFNIGETSFGTSSPLWVMLLALFAAAGVDLYAAAIMLSFCAYWFSAVLIYLICREIIEYENSSLYAFAAALLYVSSGNMTWLSVSGMETALFQMLSLSSIYLFLKKGYGRATALVAGMLILCRLTGVLLVIALLAVELLKNRKISSAIITTFFIVCPYYIYHKVVTGTLLPVTAHGKVLTYVEGNLDMLSMLSFVPAVFKYLMLYEPAFFVTAILIVLGFVVKGVRKNMGFAAVAGWIVLHFAAHALMYRTLNQHFRHLAVFFPALSMLGVYSVRGMFRSRRLSCFVLGLLIFISFCNQISWKKLYGKNLHHIENVYVECANRINKNTTDTVIAAFDIGIIKHMTDRYVVDLGGLTDPAIHPYLEKQNAGAFLRKKGVSLIVYSRFPDCDVWSGIYRSAYDRAGLLKESALFSCSVNAYAAPSVTHSFQLDVRRAEWILPTDAAWESFFYVDILPDKEYISTKVAPDLELVGCELDRKNFMVVRNMAQYVSLTYYWRATAKISKKPLIRTRFVNSRSGEVIIDNIHIPTHDVFEPERWEPGRIVRENHVLWIPENAPAGTYEVRVGTANPNQAVRRGEDAMTLKEALYKIAGKPFMDFPICRNGVDGIKIAELRIEASLLEVLY